MANPTPKRSAGTANEAAIRGAGNNRALRTSPSRALGASASASANASNSNIDNASADIAAWLTTTESRFTELRQDVRGLVGGGFVLATMLVGAGWLLYKDVNIQLTAMSVTQERIAGKIENIDMKVTSKFEQMDIIQEKEKMLHKK